MNNFGYPSSVGVKGYFWELYDIISRGHFLYQGIEYAEYYCLGAYSSYYKKNYPSIRHGDFLRLSKSKAKRYDTQSTKTHHARVGEIIEGL